MSTRQYVGRAQCMGMGTLNTDLSIASTERLLPPRYFVLLQSAGYGLTKLLLGALVLAHSLKDAGTTKKLAVLVTTDTVSADAMVQLQVTTSDHQVKLS